MENIFNTAILPPNEEQRLENLKKYKIFGTQSEVIFNQLAAVTATLLKVPVAMINFVDKDNVWTKADQKGESGKITARSMSLCSLAILNDHITVFEDAVKDPFLMVNPWLAGHLDLRFYAAAPITTSEGFNIGAVCIVDKTKRTFNSREQKKLEWIAAVVRAELEKRTDVE
ncbi:serine/threonine protein kinase [Pedobacter sp. HMWF019]|uniref:GAF domain-containing protein n=1 Tax=Pedobacter sp. HMWF019 TaxID=2056856 RepID=UPI000D3DC632|nr:GAF domain-containing protein [Pedobacter sp. HMWF019]PTT01746.1 serine/threonine protein kinase [Pedobacter sp. HMWF019]